MCGWFDEQGQGGRGAVLATAFVSVGGVALTTLIATGVVAPFSMFSMEVTVMLAVVGWLGVVRPALHAGGE